MATPSARTPVHDVLERAHHPGLAHQIYTDKIQFRQLFLRPTSPTPDDAAAKAEAAAASGHNGREARREARRIKQEQRRARQSKPKPLSARERRRMGLAGSKAKSAAAGTPAPSHKKMVYSTFIPLHRLWLGYIREVLGPQELRCGGQGAAAKLTAADFHGAEIEVTRSACVGRVGIRGIVVRDARFIFEVVTRHNEVKMVPKEGTFFCVEIPVEDEQPEPQDTQDQTQPPKLVFEIVGSQFLHRATDRANRKFKQHFYKEL